MSSVADVRMPDAVFPRRAAAISGRDAKDVSFGTVGWESAMLLPCLSTITTRPPVCS